MSQTRFDYCVEFVLEHETEYNRNGEAICEHDRNDPGGTTKWGIDQRSHPKVDICSLTKDSLSAGWDLALFDAAVNLGAGWAIPAMQRVLGVKSDGSIGPLTIAAANSATPDDLERYLQAREAHYRALNPRLVRQYLNGWLNRVADLRKPISTSMIA